MNITYMNPIDYATRGWLTLVLTIGWSTFVETTAGEVLEVVVNFWTVVVVVVRGSSS